MVIRIGVMLVHTEQAEDDCLPRGPVATEFICWLVRQAGGALVPKVTGGNGDRVDKPPQCQQPSASPGIMVRRSSLSPKTALALLFP
jgi:hypothetical protein